MKKIIMGRGYGKTSQLIFLSAKKKIPILTPYNKEYIIRLAKELGKDIPDPISLGDLSRRGGYKGSVLVDNADLFFERLLAADYGVYPDTITLTPD